MRIYGIASAEKPDRVGETALIDGMHIEPNAYINDEHGATSKMFNVLGHIVKSKKIFDIKECANEREKKCWNLAKAPFLYVEGALADEEEHPNAQAASSLVKYSAKHAEFNLGFSVEGGIDERKGNILTKTEVRGVSLTINPCNPLCRVFAMDDLAKSLTGDIRLPDKYKTTALSKRSFRKIPDEASLCKAKISFIKEVASLHKSGDIHKASVIKCWGCGSQKVYVTPRLPNACIACGEKFSMKDINKALNYEGDI